MAETFSSAQVCAATGCTYRTLDNWVRCGYLEMENPFPGSGVAREFTFKEALQVAVIVEVSNTGVYPKRVHPGQVIRDEGVYHKEWSTMTINLAELIINLAWKLGINLDAIASPQLSAHSSKES